MFSFIKYINPSWYFNLKGRKFDRYWVAFDDLSDEEKTLVDQTEEYNLEESKQSDIAYQAWIKGIIYERINKTDIFNSEKTDLYLQDEYKFIRRHFNFIWVIYILMVRVAELNNPLTELKAFFLCLRVKRINPYKKVKDWKLKLKSFNFKNSNSTPKVTVIIPTLNRYKYLSDALNDLEVQTYQNFEVLIVDQSEPFQKDFYRSFNLDLKAWHQEEKALWLARNTAIAQSAGELILLFDDDSRIEPNWIESHFKCLEYFKADISSGVSISTVGAKVPETYSYYKWSDQIDTGNVMIKKNVFREIGLFDRQFEKQRQGDGEFGLRAYLAGFKNISNPDAMRIHLKVSEGGLRQMGSWDGWRPKKFFAPRPVPSVLYLTRKYFGNKAALYQIMTTVLPSLIPYRFKRNEKLMLIGSMLSLILLPIISISVIKSWRQSSQKLSEGAKIPELQ